MITYNHEPFIKEAIEGVLKQNTTFPIKLIIGEDNSTDNTRRICEEYVRKYPKLISLLPKLKNRLGMSNNFVRTLYACKGDFISFCEGDDYWIYENKLEEQVLFLEQNKSYNLCSHIYSIISPKHPPYVDRYQNVVHPSSVGLSFEMKDHFRYWLTKMLTLTIRNNIDFTLLSDKYKYIRDAHIVYHSLKNSKGYCLNVVGGVYRIHKDGIHSSLNSFQKAFEQFIVYQELWNMNKSDKLLKHRYKSVSKNFINHIIKYDVFCYKKTNKSDITLTLSDKKNIYLLLFGNPLYTIKTILIILIKKFNLNRPSLKKH